MARISLLALALLCALLPVTAQAAPAWLPHEPLSPALNHPQVLWGTDVAMAPNGDALAVYGSGSPDATGFTYTARHRAAGGTWTTETIASGRWYSLYLSTAVNDAGQGIAAWVEPSGNVLVASVRKSDGTWTAPQVLESGVAGPVEPSVVVAPTGVATVVWRKGAAIRSQRWSPTSGFWGTAEDVATVAGAPEGSSLAIDQDAEGDVSVAYASYGTPKTVHVSDRAVSGSTWTHSTVFTADEVTQTLQDIDLDVAPNGTAAMTLQAYRSSGGHRIHGAARPAGAAAWQHRDIGDIQDVGGKRLQAAAGNDAAAIVWGVENGNSSSQDFASLTTWSTQGGWAATQELTTRPDHADQWRPVGLTMTGRGDLTALYYEYDHSAQRVRWVAQHRPAGDTAFGPETIVREVSGPVLEYPDFAHDEAGNLVATWVRRSGSYDIVFEGAGFDGAGPRLSGLVAPDGEVGQELTFGVQAADVWSTLDGQPTWTFGDGGTGTGTAPKHTYAAPGTYPVSVQATDARGNQTTRSASVTISANQAPTASFTATPNPVRTGQKVTFDATAASDPDGAVTQYAWDLDGDGTYADFAAAEVVEAIYPAAGVVTVGLKVKDNRGAVSAAATKVVTVEKPPAPAPDATPDAEKQAPAPAPAEPGQPQGPGVDTRRIAEVTIVSAKRVRKLPNLVGRNVDDARALLDKTHFVDYEIDWVHRTRRAGARVGDVVDQSPEAGDREDSGPADLLRMQLDVYAGPAGRNRDADCPAGMKAALRGADLDLGRALIEATKCEVAEVDYSATRGATDTQIDGAKLVSGGDEVALEVDVPTATEHQGLFLIVRGWRKAKSQQLDENWRIVADAKLPTCFAVQVIDRSRSLVANATVTVDASDAGGDDFGDTTNKDGLAELCGRFPNGLAKGLDVVARAEGRNGHALNGATRIAVKAYNATKTYRNTLGQTISRATTEVVPTARAAGLVEFLANAWNVVASLGQRTATFFTDVSNGMQAKANAIGAAIQKGWAEAARSQLAVPGNLNPGGLISGGATVIAAGGGNVIAAGGGNVIAAGGGNVIAAGGGNRAVMARATPRMSFADFLAGLNGWLSLGGGNVIAAGGGNVIAAGGGNVIAPGGANVIAAGGGNVIAAGGGNVIAPGGGNVIAPGGGNVIAPGGGNRARAAQATAATDWLLRAAGQVLSVGPTGAIITSTPSDVLWGGGHFTSAVHGGDVKDAKKANVVQPDKTGAPDVWALQRTG